MPPHGPDPLPPAPDAAVRSPGAAPPIPASTLAHSTRDTGAHADANADADANVHVDAHAHVHPAASPAVPGLATLLWLAAAVIASALVYFLIR